MAAVAQPPLYAHTLPDLLPGRWQPLAHHLTAVAEQAEAFAMTFGAGPWARLAGQWHDLGKCQSEFQEMLHAVAAGRQKRRVDHSSAGAIHATKVLAPRLKPAARELARLVALAIAGHHSGLADGRRELDERVESRAHLLEKARVQAPSEWLDPMVRLTAPEPLLHRSRNEFPADRALALEFLVRMVFSCLVDADRLDTQRFLDENLVTPGLRGSGLRSSYAVIPELRQRIDAAIDEKALTASQAPMSHAGRRLHDYRQQVLDACRAAAEEAPGLFSLAVDTGGGKTLSALSFALRHGERHGLRRVIVVIPFTSIVEQTADVYRSALGDLADNVLEHHSAMEEDAAVDPEGSPDPLAVRRRLSMENWDAPVVVTTAVQFFESLYAASPSRCRKLHNVARSVVILDEAQTLPPGLLDPTVWVINELAERYGTTIVVSTATQPALERPFPELRSVRPIVPAVVERPPPRVRVEVAGEEAVAWPDLAARLATYPQVLCITHRRADAQDLARAVDSVVGNVDTVHLSATMCPQHRSRELARVREAIARGGTCRVVSTQLVEAGVDLDFPVVFRALAGIDSLVQAAGRANREGKLGEGGGLLVVYRAPTDPPEGLPRTAAAAAEVMFRAAAQSRATLDLFSPDVARAFFRRYYQQIGDMDSGIAALRRELPLSLSGGEVPLHPGRAGVDLDSFRCDRRRPHRGGSSPRPQPRTLPRVAAVHSRRLAAAARRSLARRPSRASRRRRRRPSLLPSRRQQRLRLPPLRSRPEPGRPFRPTTADVLTHERRRSERSKSPCQCQGRRRARTVHAARAQGRARQL